MTRKVTAAIFFTDAGGQNRECKLGCLAPDNISRKVIKFHNSGHLEQHVKAAHQLLWQQFCACKNNADNYNVLLANIDSAFKTSASKIEKNKKNTLKWPKAVAANLDGAVRSNLLLLMWQIVNAVGRLSANCPIMDLYLRSLGTNPAVNRHELQVSYLPLLSSLVVQLQQRQLADCTFVNLSSDGWRSRTRQDFVSLSAAWMVTLPNHTWKIEVAEVDLIHVSGSVTADALEALIKDTIEDFVRFFLFILSYFRLIL